MEILTSSPRETQDLAARIALRCKAGDAFFLYGNLGSGKTTFVTGFLAAIDSSIRVQSPTFVFVRDYKLTKMLRGIKRIYHLDLYRARILQEALDLGIEDIIAGDLSVALVEWPDVLGGFVKEDAKRIDFEFVDEKTRKIVTNFDC
ncbi:MAG: tRNA (adenosine(37)-N6)-threonylcarbamoyltransferase complex ATPase subunit type 1 TsaE [Patescibacteria group bacterium]